MMKDEVIVEERLRAAANHLERLAEGSEPEIAMQELAPELVEYLRDAADSYQRANEFRESWERASVTSGRGEPPRVRSIPVRARWESLISCRAKLRPNPPGAHC
jgi:hypothetical protein